MTPYYEDEATTVYLGDCREILPALDLSPSLILTDPPYGDTSLEWDTWPLEWIEYMPSSADQMWCFGSMRMFLAHGMEWRGWTYAQEVVWEKHNGSGFHADRFKRVHEFAMHFYRGAWGGLTINPQTTPDAVARSVRRKKGRPAHMGNIEQTPYQSVDRGPLLQRSVIYCRSMHGSAIHPTEKPVGILEPLIRYSTGPGDLILDPFAGSCSTARAARLTGRRTVCVEANEAYLESAVRSLAQAPLDFGASA